MSSLTLTTPLAPFGPAAAIVLTDEQVAALGASVKNPPVTVTIGGRTARLRVARMDNQNVIGFSKAVRADLGVEIGEAVEAVIALDAAERTVDVPEMLADALAGAGLRDVFDGMPYSRRKELARAVSEAKREETRERRVAAALDEVRERASSS
ncbi:MAG TPA: YdeI/OmpD-associated family protein [Ornithinicoccus sp.]|nr:YdeI/OmpD-associated family protein [Ornithinicoccus sp.]